MDTSILRPKSLNDLDREIERLTDILSTTDPTDNNYKVISDNLARLCEARSQRNDRAISMDTLVSVAANIIGMLVVLNFERTGVITSKAFSMLWKSKS